MQGGSTDCRGWLKFTLGGDEIPDSFFSSFLGLIGFLEEKGLEGEIFHGIVGDLYPFPNTKRKRGFGL